MRVISFRDTVLYKRGVRFSAAALVAAVAAPSLVDGSIFSQPLVHLVPILILAGIWIYFLHNGRFFTVVDEVDDCIDYLQVRRGRTEVRILFSSICAAEVSTTYRMHRITVHLRAQTALGSRLDFWPQASHWGNVSAVRRVATDLAERARRAVGSH